jgi:integrase
LGRYPWRTLLTDYLNSAFDGKTLGYQRQVRRYLMKCAIYLERLNIEPRPRELTEKDISALHTITKWVSFHERHMVMTRLRPFLTWCGNRVMNNLAGKLDLRPPTPHRQQYKAGEIKALIEAATEPYERWLIHIETDYGARKITVMRAKVEDFDLINGVAMLRVKGRGGTKTMEAPLHPDTSRYLDAALQKREAVIARCRARGYKGPIPPEILLKAWKRRPKPLTSTALDNLLIRICRKAGVKPRGHHANRRGVAKLVYDLTKDLIATQAFLGHADPKTTEAYIGTGLDKQKIAQDAVTKALASAP